MHDTIVLIVDEHFGLKVFTYMHTHTLSHQTSNKTAKDRACGPKLSLQPFYTHCVAFILIFGRAFAVRHYERIYCI